MNFPNKNISDLFAADVLSSIDYAAYNQANDIATERKLQSLTKSHFSNELNGDTLHKTFVWRSLHAVGMHIILYKLTSMNSVFVQ